MLEFIRGLFKKPSPTENLVVKQNLEINREEAEAFARKKELWERKNLPYGS